MNKEQFEQCRHVFGVSTARVPDLMDLVDRSPRTLLYGYGANYVTHHVYIGSDGFIHVLRYVPLFGRERASSGGYDFLVLTHTYGEAGGLTDILQYVPDQRVHPAYSDFEFCALLKGWGVEIPFAGFNEYAKQRTGYQGETVEQGRSAPGADVMGEVQELLRSPAFAGAPASLAYRLVGHAARETKTPHGVVGGGAWIHVAENGAGDVLANVAEYIFDMHENELFRVDDDDLVFAAFEGVDKPTVEARTEHHGSVALSIRASDRMSLKAEGFKGYPAQAEGYPENALVGTYRNRPFILYRPGEGKFNVQFSQFGDPDRFLDNNLNRGKPRHAS